MNTRRLAAALFLWSAVLPVRAERLVSDTGEAKAPRADASVRAALRRGDAVLNVLVGIRERDRGDAKASRELERRSRRLEAEGRVVASLAPGDVLRHKLYGGFPVIAARATRRGLLALANRDDVAWITIDAVRYRQESVPQPAQLLIHSSDANAAGFDGEGQTIAILDTGVDYTIPALGGGSFPNDKVIAGLDFGDHDADPMDCEGHGTSVAGVAAGPGGVAPAARIVALKISRAADCGTALDSDILGALDWVLQHRDEFDIGEANLSFGSTPFDGRDHGFCDLEIPQYATAVEALQAAGVVFVAASGNEAVTNAISAPACLSTALSAGAVYPQSFTEVSWGTAGDEFCADHSVSPDAVTCFSNSASTLALLAPGAFWSVETLHGAVEQFHGTSASSPTVAGAVALLRQARPELSPTAVGSLLRATGKTIADSRNGVLTPRIDILAAIQQPAEAFAPFDGADVPIPDGADAATATAEIAGFTGNIAGVAAVVEIEHDDPRQLSVTLTGPDGTPVLLHDRTGSPGRALNAVYGRTLGSAQPLAAFQGKPANGTWTLEVRDEVAGTQGHLRNFAIRLIPGQPAVAIPRGAAGRVFPLVGRVQGTKFFLSDARVFNPGSEPATFSLYYVPQGGGGGQAVRATRVVAPGEVLALDDVVGTEFGYAESIGELTLTGPNTGFLATSRAYTHGDNGTFGVFVPSFGTSEGIGSGEKATANGLAKSGRLHTNAGFTEISGAATTVRMDLVASDGRLLSTVRRGAPPNGTVLVTDVVADRGLGATSNFRIDYSIEGTGGRVVPFATLIDDATGDGVFETAEAAPLSSDDIVIAQASHATGANSDFFRTDLHVTNLGAAAASFTISLLPRTLSGTPEAPQHFALGPGQTLELPDVLQSVFGLGDPSAAGLRIHPAGSTRLRVSSRTYVEKFGGTFGFAIPGVPVGQSLGAGEGSATVLQLDQSSASNGFRSNFGMAEVAGQDVEVRVEARRGDGSGPLGAKTYRVAAGKSLQASLGDLLPEGHGDNVYLRFRVAQGGGRVLAYGVSIDNTSGDAIYIPAEKDSAIVPSPSVLSEDLGPQ